MEHVRPSAGAVREENNVIIPLSCDRQGPNVVNSDGYFVGFWARGYIMEANEMFDERNYEN